MRYRALVAMAAALLAVALPAVARERGSAGEFDYYALVLSWSPTYCDGEGRGDDGPQCHGGRPFAFVLHGLWPQYERGWPRDCRLPQRPWVPQPLIDSMLDIMPSPRLVIHEYRTHGTCSGLSPQGYYDLARRLYGGISIPARFRDPVAAITVSPAEVEAEFLKANPALTPDMITIVCRHARLSELRICFSRDERPRACGSNEDQGRLCAVDKVTMPPVRARR
jgi:ribonuclease T2